MNSYLTRGQAETKQQARERFLGEIFAITGDTRVLFTPKPTDTTTSLDESLTGRTITHDATIAARLQALGLGYYTTIAAGTTQFSSAPDAADLSFGTGAADIAVSMLVLANITDTAAIRALLARNLASNLEFNFNVSATDKLAFFVFDNSLGVNSDRTSTASINMGAWALLGMTYTGAGGATAMNNCILYQNGVVMASAATNNASYVAMEDKATVLGIGNYSDPAAGNAGLTGSLALVIICAKVLTPSEMWTIKKLCNAFFNLSL